MTALADNAVRMEDKVDQMVVDYLRGENMERKIKGKLGERYNRSKRIDWEKITVEDVNGILRPMNGEEIVEDIYLQTGIKTSRQNISNALKSAMRSFYLNLSEMEPELTPFQVASLMLQMLYIPNARNDKEFRGGVESFFRLFPKDIKDRIERDARKYYAKESDKSE